MTPIEKYQELQAAKFAASRLESDRRREVKPSLKAGELHARMIGAEIIRVLKGSASGNNCPDHHSVETAVEFEGFKFWLVWKPYARDCGGMTFCVNFLSPSGVEYSKQLLEAFASDCELCVYLEGVE